MSLPATASAAFAASLLYMVGFCGSAPAFQAAAGQPKSSARITDDQKQAAPAAAHAPLAQGPLEQAKTSAESANAAPAARGGGATDAEPPAVEPLSLEYVPRDAVVVAAFRPSAMLNCDAFASLNKLLAKSLELEKLAGISLERIRQLTVVFMLEESPSFSNFSLPDGTPVVMKTDGRVIQPEPVAAILRLARREDVAAIAKALAPETEEFKYAGRAYVRAKGADDGSACLLADNLTVVVADEPHLRRMIVAGRTGASSAKWTRSWQQAAGSDLAVLANITAIRNLVALKLRDLGEDEAPKVRPPSVAALFESETALLTIDIRERILARLQLAAESLENLERIHAAVKPFLELSHAAMSQLRAPVSSDASEKGAELLTAIDILDSTLDSITVTNHGAHVEAAAALSMDDATKMVRAWLATLVEEDESDPEIAPQPAPAER